MTKRAIIIDADPGQDDAFALLLALACSDQLEVIGVTAVSGNLEVVHTAANALKVLKLAKREDIPVFAGASSPLIAPPVYASAIHGPAIMQGWDLPASSVSPQDAFAPDWIVDTVCTMPPKSVTLCALGPLTNIALAIAKKPEVCSRLDQIVLMGGAQVQGGNMTPVSEFNIFADPHAAARVFAAPVRKVVVSLDVTAKLPVSLDWIAAVARIDKKKHLSGLLELYAALAREGHPRPLHDPAVIAWLLEPELFRSEEVNVEIETTPGLCYGQTVLDRNGLSKRKPNARWVTDVGASSFYEMLLKALRKVIPAH